MMTSDIMEMVSPTNLINIAFNEHATASELMLLVGSLTVFWGVFFLAGTSIITPLVHGKKWIITLAERDYHRGGKELYKALGMELTKEEFINRAMENWAYVQCVIVQHLIGGMLCLPAILNLGSHFTASRLVCLGIFSEMGYEISDIANLLYQRFFSPDGQAKVPNTKLVVIILHHSMTTVLGLPLVLYYGDNSSLHWLCFNLQAAAAIALIVMEHSKTLDISKPRELQQFRHLALIALIVMVWTRGFHWVYLCFSLIQTWYNDSAWSFLVIGSIMAFNFSIFNWSVCIVPFYKRYQKFSKSSAEYAALPASVDFKTRRRSIIQLQDAAAAITACHSFENELSRLFVDRVVSRRESMPQSILRSKKRASIELFRSSTGDISTVVKKILT